jgi:hypothetical protein
LEKEVLARDVTKKIETGGLSSSISSRIAAWYSIFTRFPNIVHDSYHSNWNCTFNRIWKEIDKWATVLTDVNINGTPHYSVRSTPLSPELIAI